MPSAVSPSLAWAHPLVQEWFTARFSTPTEPQEQGWPHILAGHTTLISAPTGSGKTLAAFLACINRLVCKALAGELRDRTEVLYVSPLKALGNDIQKNLEVPLGEILQMAGPRKELPYSGVFRVSPDGKTIQLVTKELSGPNGLAFSPDEKYFYVDNWEDKRKIILRYEVNPDGTLSNGKVFFDMTSTEGEDALDGMKVDQKGNLYVSGPGGVWIISPDGKHLGTIAGPEHPHNFAWGDDDGKTLYLCAQTGLYRIRLKIPGIRPSSQ